MLLLAPLALFAAEEEITFRGQTIYVKGAPQQIWIGDKTSADAELVLLYTNFNAAVNSLRTEQKFEARVLVVGGGGAGGYGSTGGTNPGGGGGGGEVKELENAAYDAGTLTMTIGAGGKQTTAAGNGENGHPTSFMKPGETITALGGGGGGAKADGNSGTDIATGGGGGGQIKSGVFGQGGTGKLSKGGNAASNNRSGGGGGAGGDGESATTGTGSKSGSGGSGAPSDITNSVAGVTTKYGGGGGAGQTSNTTPDYAGKGKDGGGHGGFSGTPGEDGKLGTGGGGGGGGRQTTGNKGAVGGAGGSGVVIIRITKIYVELKWVAIDVSAGGNDGKIFVDENANYEWKSGDLLITYTNTTVDGGLAFFNPTNAAETLPPVWAKARVLVVGGGGGGGCISERGNGAGAGGGAGGVVERTGLVFDNSVEYSISIGAGGLGGAVNEEVGGGGKESYIKTNGFEVVDTALGGGGGGAHSPGQPGASGGGGSRTITRQNGGEGTQGYKGGDGVSGPYMAAGGGGAGGPGEDADNNVALKGGDGGKGVSSDITGNTEWYAAGGGGAYMDDANLTYKHPGGVGGGDGEGGHIIGGNGAGTPDGVVTKATNGKDGTGSGGGGGISNTGADEKAGKGGDGIVIIRLSGFVVRNIPLPVPQGPFVYDGTEKRGVDEFFAYDLSGEPTGTDSKVYTVTATMEPGSPYYWADWHEGDPEEKKWGSRTVSWEIHQMKVEVPGASSNFVYNAKVQTPVDKTRFKVDAQGFAWVKSELSGLLLKYCQLEEYEKTDAGNYTVTAKLVRENPEGAFATNFVWNLNPRITMENQSYAWSIAQASNAISNFYYTGYRWPDRIKAHHPKNQFDVAWGRETTITKFRVDNGDGTFGEWQDWGTAGPSANGNYEVWVKIPEHNNWQGDEATLKFGTWEKWSDLFTDRMEITVSGNTSGSTELKDFPVPVRIHAPTNDGYEVFSGFDYTRAGATGKEIHFFDQDGDPVEHDVDTWLTRGESLVWVRVPKLKNATTKLTMCWKRVNGIRLPDYDGAAVWKDYYGVWHMSKPEGSSFTDASGNELHAVVQGGASVTTIDGRFGKGVYVNAGNVVVPGYNALGLSADFMFSGWYRNDQGTAANFNFVGTKMGKGWNYAPGWSFFMNTATQVGASAAGSWGGYDLGANMKTKLQHLTYVAPKTGTTRTAYFNGANARSPAGDISTNTLPLQLVGAKFSCDEARLRKGVPANAAAWAKEEYNSLNNANYCTYGLVIREELLCDWWTPAPSIAKTVWHKGDTPPTVGKGAYKHAGASGSVTYVCANQAGEPVTTNALPTEIGFYKATFDHTNPSGKVDNVWYEYRPQPHVIDFYIIEKKEPTHDLGGDGGDSGRILLMNADGRADYPVKNQGWCARSETGVTRWVTTAGDDNDGTNNIMGGTSFELVRCADTNVLWTLTECRQGNLFPTNDTEALSSSYCYLPESSATALSITNEDVAATRGSTGWVMMRNTMDACIMSSCFTNGIGTIYFDAVNSRKSVAENADAYRLVLEIATKTKDGLPPVDSNCWVEVEAGVTNRYGKLEGMWQPVMMYPMTVHSGSYSDKAATDELALAETTGGRDSYHYRVHAPLVEYGPVRFRIRRTTTDTTAEGVDDGFILIDNVIVSVPPVSATLKPYGHFDPDLAGDTAVGFGGAFETPFPSVTGAAFPGRCKITLPPGTQYEGKSPSEYISMAQMFYRWRHLGQFADWRMAVLTEDGKDGMRTEGDLEVPAVPGDLEFYFVSMMKTDYYQYVDYTGRNVPVWPSARGGYTEEIAKKESVMDLSEYKVTRLASGGTNWFVRIRDGASTWEGMTLELRGAISNDCPMRLVADGSWRALAPIPTNAEGQCTFRFRGRNDQKAAGAKEYRFNTTAFGGGAEEVELPRSGILSGGGEATPFTVDHIANYLEFRLGADGGDSPTWSVSRAEYQNFNNWNDVWSSAESQLFATGTNGVNDVAMTTKNLDMASWRLYAFEDGAWNETFTLSNYNDPGFPKETFFQNHATPSVWNGYNLTFVSKNLSAYKKPTEADTASGMAAKLKGQGGGILEYNKSNSPKGLEHIRFTARIGQSIGFDDISYSADQSRKQDYTFVCPVSMSHAVADDAKAGDMSVGGAVSLFAYYRESKGCYEFRVTRAASGLEVLMELFKWHPVNGAMQQDRLCGQRFNFANADSLKLWNNSGEVAPKHFAMFISARTSGGGTEIYGGLGKDEQEVTDDTVTFSGTQAPNGYGGLHYVDNAGDRLTSGSYGVAAKDCPAQFVRPRHYDWPVGDAEKGSDTPSGLTATDTYAGGKYFKPSANKNFHFATDTASSSVVHFDYADIADGFWELGPQIEAWGARKGLRTPVGLSQDVLIELQARNGGAWFVHKRVPVSGYALAEKTVQVHMTGDYNLRVTTGEKAVDVVIGEVRQRQWQGIDHENLAYGSDAFVYTQGVVESNDFRKAKEVLLQPSRGVATKPLSVRSPVLSGLGKVSFSYEDADPNAEIWVQVATNSVEYNLTSDSGYNLSVKSVERGEPEPVGTWITVAKFGASPECPDGPLGKSGVRTVYLGWHDQANAPVRGAYRVFIPPAVVERAIVLATNETQNVDYGRIAVTGMTVTDEPGISERCWRGWNLRTAGDEEDRETRMFLDDGLIDGSLGHGLSCALNNSVNDMRDGDAETAAFNNPTIWSPTLEQTEGQSRSIGSVTFRARLYHAGDARETETGGVVSLYGATTSLSENWTKLVDVSVTSSTFSNFTWTALGSTRYRAVKLVVSGPAAKTRNPDRDRVLVDEISLTEKLDTKIGFEYVRPFRTDLYEPVEIADIESPNEQPLVGESWGVQTKLRLEQLGREVSGLEVYLTWFAGESPWGYGMWKERAAKPVRLVPVGDAKAGIFRSVGTSADALVPPQSDAGVVQYMVILKYAGEGEETAVQQVEPTDWAPPSWYWPVDLNKSNGGYDDPDRFSPYTVLDGVSPGRAWINEVNWNDGSDPRGVGALSKTNQFIEICVPQAVDMDGWSVRVTDCNMNQRTLVQFGLNVPAKKKPTAFASEHFEFMLVESPATEAAGGICDWEGHKVEADGVWAAVNLESTITGGTLEYNRPFQFELVRPSGIIEHQVVIGGTNTMASKSYGYLYEATNLLANLNEKTPSTKRFIAGYDRARAADVRYLGSLGVVGGTAEGTPAPGADGTWKEELKHTPGRLNEDQVIPPGWYLPPTGTNCWVTLRTIGSHLMQSAGGETGSILSLVVPKDTPTNVTYRATNWYEIASLTVDGVTNATHVARGGREWVYTLMPTGQLCDVVATEGYDSGLDKYGIRPGADYASEVLNWLVKKAPNATAEDICLAAFHERGQTDSLLDLTAMYWLDIPPVPENEAEKAAAEAGGTNWWLCGGVVGWRPNSVTRTVHYGAGDVDYINTQVDIQLYVSNAVSGKAKAPAYLQGHDNRLSTESGNWNSETFQVIGALFNGKEFNQGYLPFRSFVFDSNSFSGPEAEQPFTSTVEIFDPFSTESPGYSYGWSAYPRNTPFFFKWRLSTNAIPQSVEKLRVKSTYGD